MMDIRSAIQQRIQNTKNAIANNVGNSTFDDSIEKGIKDETAQREAGEVFTPKKEEPIEKAITGDRTSNMMEDFSRRRANISAAFQASSLDDKISKSLTPDSIAQSERQKMEADYALWQETLKEINSRQILTLKDVDFLAKSQITMVTADKLNAFADDLEKAVTENAMTAEQVAEQKVMIAGLSYKRVAVDNGFANVYISSKEIEKAINAVEGYEPKVAVNQEGQAFTYFTKTVEKVKENELKKSEEGEKIEKDSSKKKDRKKLRKAVQNDLLEKGVISDKIASGYGYGSEPFKFVKKGSEIKAGIPASLAILEIEKAALEAKCQELLAKIECEPTDYYSDSSVPGVVIPRFGWQQCERKESGSDSYTEEQENCQKYNSIANLLCQVACDIETLKVLAKNVDDKKDYTLSVSQLIALNFK